VLTGREAHPDVQANAEAVHQGVEEVAGLLTGQVPLCHMEFSDEGRGWQEAAPPSSPTLSVALSLSLSSYREMNLQEPDRRTRSTVVSAVADTGAQMDILSLPALRAIGLDPASLVPVKARVSGAVRGSKLDILGCVLLEVQGPAASAGQPSTRGMFYVASNVTRCYLSLSCLQSLAVVPPDFPSLGSAAAGEQQGSCVAASGPALQPCSNSGVMLPGDPPCSCPTRSLAPSTGPELPCPPTEENLPKLKEYLLTRYRSNAFNTCERQKLPLMSGSPPLKLNVDPTVKPVACHVPAPVPLHWQEAVRAGIERDVRLGVLERVPLNTPVRWQSRMVVVPKHDGSPRRTVDYGAVNTHCPRQTHHTPSPWLLASSVPEGMRKTVCDNWHGYHSLPLASEEDRDLSTFITPFGRFRYLTGPQGLRPVGDGFTDRMDRTFEDFERTRRCVDDTLLYDQTIEQQFFRVCEFLDRCSANGIILNPAKFQFAEMEVEFVGFTVTATGVRPTKEFLDNILSFPTPTNITDVRSWFGAVQQVAYAFSVCPVMEPFRHLLSNKVPFSWSPDLEAAFQASKKEVVRQCMEGVRSFNPSLPTCLATDWSKFGIGYWLCQKRCSCPGRTPGCCPTGWQTVSVGSRFCHQAEQNYAPIEGEALASAWGANKCRYFLLGLADFTLALDHKPLIPIFGQKALDMIANPRIMNQKVKLLPFNFTPAHIPGKANVAPDTWSRRGDSPVAPVPPSPPVDIMDIANVGRGYSSKLGPPAWVSGPIQDCSSLAAGPAVPRTTPTREDEVAALETEQLVAGLALSAIEALDSGAVLVAGHTAVRAITWPRLQEAAAASNVYKSLIELIQSGMPEEKAAWPETLTPYHPYRRHLIVVEGVVLCGERPLVPPDLRPEVLEILHAGHSGVSTMLARAGQSLFWPNLRQDVLDVRAHCKECLYTAPSNPAQPPHAPVEPSFPFSHICIDFFQVEATYLAIADRYSNWLSIFRLAKDDSYHIIETLRSYFARWGVAEEITSDGASVLTSAAMKDFLSRWGVRHRVSSAYYPRANKRSELGVKAAKRLVMGNLGPQGSLNTDRFARALLEHRNSVDPLTGLSASMVLFGRELKGFLPSQVSKYQPRKEWRLEADLREKAHAKRHARMADRLTFGSRPLAPLQTGDTVAVQNQEAEKGKTGKWTKTGEIVEVLPFDSYIVKIHGSCAPTKRNRRFLRKIIPYSSLLPVELPLAASPAVTRAAQKIAEELVPQPVEQAATPTPPHSAPPPSAPELRPLPPGMVDKARPFNRLDSRAHRQVPVTAPTSGQEAYTILRERERDGHHLALWAGY
jgi:hypothetical protein